ncbi:MAG: hypothetical protein Q8R76_01085 [Candidatus Omnitrophota bacterium]|nr:hypothetical protein [Candidatus Omnitrophota bacterium]
MPFRTQPLSDDLDSLVPPPELRRPRGIEASAYIKDGHDIVSRVRASAGLTPNSHVLDVGCGSGRFASALTQFLEAGSYSGLEVQHPSSIT